MWPKSYKDYPKDLPLKRQRVESGKGITGCEMHDLNGWGSSYHYKEPRRKGVIATFLSLLFSKKKRT